MPALPFRLTIIIASAILALLATAILVSRDTGGRGVLLEVRDPPHGVDELRVDVGGAIVTPGVYRLPPGARVADAIEAAGGATTEADLAPLNLARRVTDEDRIRVPRRGERDAAIDLNAASARELEELPGIGPVRARSIIEARADRPFASTDELLSRDLVPHSVYLEIRDLVATPVRDAGARDP